MPTSSIPPSHEDLIEAPLPVAFATVGPTGHPQVTYIWAVRDGANIITSLTGSRQKTKNLRERAQATVFIADPTNQMRTLEVRGEVTIEPDPELNTLRRVVQAYGADLDSFGGPLEDRQTVTIRPTHVVAQG